MLTWLASLVCSSLTFAIADVLCDICIAEHDEDAKTVESAADDEGSENEVELQSQTGTPGQSKQERYVRDSDGGLQMLGVTLSRPNAGPRYKQISGDTPGRPTDWSSTQPAVQHEDELVALTGEQDAAVAGIVTIIMLLVTVVYTLSPTGSSGRTSEVTHLRWGPTTHVQFWFAMLGGSMAFMHYFFLLKAFEGAPSTVLLPLVQVASVSVLLGSSVVALTRNEPWITPVQGLAYLLMFIGGILPSCGGQLSALTERAFWRQSFVYFAILAEFSLGLHDLMLSGCAYDSERTNPDHVAASDEPVESTEFFVWSRVSFVLTFIGMYLLSPKLYTQLRDLLSGRVAMKYIGLSAISEGLTILGFYLASIAYGLFSQAAIVHAAEASLSQLLNLLIAYCLLRGFGIGRPSAVGSMTAKFISFIMVTLGLFLCTLDDGSSHSATNNAVPAVASTAPMPLPGTVPGFDTPGYTGVDQTVFSDVVDVGRGVGGGSAGAY